MKNLYCELLVVACRYTTIVSGNYITKDKNVCCVTNPAKIYIWRVLICMMKFMCWNVIIVGSTIRCVILYMMAHLSGHESNFKWSQLSSRLITNLNASCRNLVIIQKLNAGASNENFVLCDLNNQWVNGYQMWDDTCAHPYSISTLLARCIHVSLRCYNQPKSKSVNTHTPVSDPSHSC